MTIVGYSWWLATEAVRLLFVLWPVSAVLVIAAVALGRLDTGTVVHNGQSLGSVLFLFPVLSLIWGALARLDEPAGSTDLWRVVILGLIVAAQAVATLAVIYVSRGQRGRTGAVGMLIGWFGLLCAYLSRLAVTGTLPVGPES